MTERLYYTDAYLEEFDATVLRAEPRDGHFLAVLDRTAFYPTSGGQPFDTGSLGATRVLDVVDEDDGTIVHVVEGPLAPGPIHGRIDWDRRFEHMQQHTGQHVLSAAFDRVLGARTESFHLGSVSSTIDLGRSVTPDEIQRAELEANRVVFEDRPVTVRFADAAEAARLPLRKEPARGGVLRIIDVDRFDVSACGGTHVSRTGAIGTIVVASLEKFRGGTRVEFLCGLRTLKGYGALRGIVAASTKLVPVQPAELPAGIERLQAEGGDARKQLKDAQARLASYEAASIAERAEARGSRRIVVESLDAWDANGLKAIAGAITERPAHVAILFGTSPPGAVVVAAAADTGIDASATLKQLTDRFGGKGGGRATLAQGAGLQGASAEMIAFARASIP